MEEPSKHIKIRIEAPQGREEKRKEEKPVEKPAEKMVVSKPAEKPPEKKREFVIRHVEKKAEERKPLFLTPRSSSVVNKVEKESYPKFFGFLLLLSFVFSGVSLYFAYLLK